MCTANNEHTGILSPVQNDCQGMVQLSNHNDSKNNIEGNKSTLSMDYTGLRVAGKDEKNINASSPSGNCSTSTAPRCYISKRRKVVSLMYGYLRV